MAVRIHIAPKIWVLIFIYLTLLYSCSLAFAIGADYNNTEFKWREGDKNIVVTDKNQTADIPKKESSIDWVRTILGGILIGIVVVVTIVAPPAGIVGWAFLGGAGVLGVYSVTEGLNIEVWGLTAVFNFIELCFDQIVNFVKTLIHFSTLGIIPKEGLPVVPYPFNLILFLLALPIVTLLTIWLIGVIIDGVEAIRG